MAKIGWNMLEQAVLGRNMLEKPGIGWIRPENAEIGLNIME